MVNFPLKIGEISRAKVAKEILSVEDFDSFCLYILNGCRNN